jgi:methionyl-tRNA synthetase
MSKAKYTVTAALPYANGPLHLGHVAGVYLPADIFVRFLRMNNHDVAFICGSDEHGAAITLRAKKEGITPQEIVDKYNAQIGKSFIDFDISFDIFHRTSAPIHHETAQDFFKVLHEKGKLTQETSEQYYDEDYSQFLADRYITGECPKCSNPSAYGDQCEKCGSDLSPTDLVNPKSTLSGKTPILKTTSHWYLPMDRHEDWLGEWIKEGMLDGVKQHDPKLWRNQVNGQCMSWIDGGLHPRAMTRDLDWGVKVPLPDSEGKVLYVWLDAPIGYISATKQWAINNNKDWKPYWYDNDTQLVHFIGKDNIVFHCIIFPVMLKLHGNILPTNVPANEFLNLEGDKMSTSRNWKLEMRDFITDFVKKENGGEQCVDMLRYYLTQIAPESKDSEFTWKGFQDSVNGELVSIFANFVNRTWVLMHKLCKGKVPAIHIEFLDDEDQAILISVKESKEKITELLEQYKYREAHFEVINLERRSLKSLI